VEGKFFFCLSGDNFNGNEFAQLASEKGAKYIVIDNPKYQLSNTILVENVLATLQELATFHRKKMGTLIFALTGSNGKTTTKELIFSVLNQSFNTQKTEGNLNNHIGVPLTLLSLMPETEIAIVEMGASHPKEIEFLCKIAQPDFGYITNFGKAHLEGFLSLEGVIEAKSELYQYLIANKKRIFFNQDDENQVNKLREYSDKCSFSLFKNPSADIQISLEKTSPFLEFKFGETTISSHLIGKYNAQNIAIAICVGRYFKLSEQTIKQGIEAYIPSNNRSQIIEKQSNIKIILDAYNANPSSMKVAIDNFISLDFPKKILILGDMKELGLESEREHQFIVDYIQQFQWEKVFLVGENFNKTSTEFVKFLNISEVIKYFLNKEYQDTFFLIKGSRSMQMEKILDFIN
jgi:UDP-N-acetylmuramoyl-tripeptide--D-alanyl-D-alanine ligase